MNHPAYQQAYNFTEGLINLGLQAQWWWMPFLSLALIVAVLRWLNRQARGAESMDDYTDQYHAWTEDRREARSRWRRWRRGG
jgi:hypothetical protein